LERAADLLRVTEVIDGKDLQDYFEGKRPLPTEEEAAAFAAARTSTNGSGQAAGPGIVTEPAPGLPSPPTGS